VKRLRAGGGTEEGRRRDGTLKSTVSRAPNAVCQSVLRLGRWESFSSFFKCQCFKDADSAIRLCYSVSVASSD
jgi:hypothetical protein